jgi:hypothetical protein
MGENAEMMLDGTLCEGCGEVFDDVIGGAEPPGYPRRCAACEPAVSLQHAPRRPLATANSRKAARHNRERHAAAREHKPFECSKCQKLFRTQAGLKQHTNDKHGETRT